MMGKGEGWVRARAGEGVTRPEEGWVRGYDPFHNSPMLAGLLAGQCSSTSKSNCVY